MSCKTLQYYEQYRELLLKCSHFIKWPDFNHGLPLNKLQWNKADMWETAVLRIVPVIAQDKDPAFWNRDFMIVVFCLLQNVWLRQNSVIYDDLAI